VKGEGYAVYVRNIDEVHNGICRDVTEQTDLAGRRLVDRSVGAYNDDLRLDASTSELRNRVLCWFRLQFLRSAEEGDQSDVDVAGIAHSGIFSHLSYRLEEREAFDISNGPTNLRDDDVHVVALSDLANARLDLVRDVRDDLYGCTEIVTSAFLANDRLIDRSRGDVRILAQILPDETLVVPQVEVRLSPIIRP